MLLDPVCLLLFLPNVARSFLCPDTDSMPLLERVMLYLVTAEKGISHTLRRHFWWYAVSVSSSGSYLELVDVAGCVLSGL